jgi:hypothetical protein
LAGAFDLHPLGIVVGLAKVFAEGFAEGLAGADRQHPPPPTNKLGSKEPRVISFEK